MKKLKEAVEAAKELLAEGKVGSERALEHTVVLPILNALGWDSRNIEEMSPEYSAGSGRVDWALCDKAEPCLFLEEKAPDQTLSSHEEQLLQYSFAEGIPLAVLTNGREWWFYLSLEEGQWGERKFAMVDVETQDTEDVCTLFSEFLKKEAVCTGSAKTTAKKRYDAAKEEKRISTELPGIIHNLLASPSEFIVEVFQTEAQAELGVLPPAALVRQALQAIAAVAPAGKVVTPEPLRVPDATTEIPPSHSKPTCLVIGDQEIQISHWYEMLVELAKWLIRHGHKLPVGTKILHKPLIGRSADAFRSPKQLENGLFIETWGPVATKYRRARWLLEQAGLSPDLLVVTWEESK